MPARAAADAGGSLRIPDRSDATLADAELPDVTSSYHRLIHRPMRVAAVQFKAVKADPERSLARLVPLVESAAPGSDLVVLPEMATTGYVFASPSEIAPLAESPDGRTFAALSPIARAHATFIVAGYVERAPDGKLYNGALVIDRAGALAFAYRKTLLYDLDHAWATPGDSGYRTFETGRGSFGVGICMDLNDDRFTAWVAASGARAIAFPTNWLDQDHEIWSYWAWRLRDSRVALVAANTWGAEGDIRFRGESAILDHVTLRAAAPRFGDAVLSAELPAISEEGSPAPRTRRRRA
jgi:predicted amidohydrolase